MSTRCTTHFRDSGRNVAIIYRHGDGYPDGHGTDLLAFLKECAKLRDPRLNDPSYLAAKLVVFLADAFRSPQAPLLEFISVGVMMEDPGDIAYMYTVDCGEGEWPAVRCFDVGDDTEPEVPIPGNFTLKPIERENRSILHPKPGRGHLYKKNCGDYVGNPRLGPDPTYQCDECGLEVPESRMSGSLFSQPIISTGEPMYRDYLAGVGSGPYSRMILKKIAREHPGNYCQPCFRKLYRRTRV